MGRNTQNVNGGLSWHMSVVDVYAGCSQARVDWLVTDNEGRWGDLIRLIDLEYVL